MVGLITVYFLAIGLVPGFKVPKPPLAGLKAAPGKTSVSARRDVRFVVNRYAINGWLYLPDTRGEKHPCVVMANGTGGTKHMLLEKYARRFQAAGMAVLSFDYRSFGDSEGNPRQLLWIPHQLQDYAAAIDFSRNLEGVDPQRIALLTMPGEWEFFEQFAPETFVNEVCARIVIRGDKYRPVKYARNVRCPVLMQVCEKDEVIPVASARETEKLLGKHADARYYPIGHFDIYKGDHFERAVEEQVGFLQKHLGTL